MKRRSFLNRALATAASPIVAGGLTLWPSQRAHAAYSGQVLVSVFLRGGCDGLNLCVPHGDQDYYSWRPNLAVAPPGATGGAYDLDGFFGLHPSLGGLKSIFDAGEMALFPSVQYEDAPRSHFIGQAIIDSGLPDLSGDGWLNRYLSLNAPSWPLRAISFGEEPAPSLAGPVPVTALTDLSTFGLIIDSAQQSRLINYLTPRYADLMGDTRHLRDAMSSAGDYLWGGYDDLQGLDPAGYVPANSASYPDTQFGTSLKDLALLIKSNVEVEAATIDLGGWDTHRAQANLQPIRLGDLSAGLTAFWQDMGSDMDRVTVLCMSEFGRTIKENASAGTDHGDAGTWFALGRSVQGGIYNGTGWPGLAQNQLSYNFGLAHTVDFRDILSEALVRHLGIANVSAVLPGHNYSPIGFLPA